MLKQHVIKASWVTIDALCLVASSALVAFLLNRPFDLGSAGIMAAAGIVRIAVSGYLGLYHAVLRFGGLHAFGAVVAASILGALTAITMGFFTENHSVGNLGRAFIVFETLFAIALCGSSRLMARLLWSWRHQTMGPRVLVWGAGGLGEAAMRGLIAAGHDPIGFIDDDASKRNSIIRGRRILGTPEELRGLVEREGPDLLLVAISHLAPHRLQEVLRICMNCDLPVKIIRDAVGVYDRLGLPAFEDIGLEDLLRRPRRNHDIGPVREIIDGKVVMVTGAGGSIGTEICRQLAKLAPAKLVLVDHSEPGLYQVTTELTDRFPEQPVLPLLMDCSDQAAVERAMLANGVQVVYHAAAYKHVPLVEENPTAGIRNNLRAAFSVAQAADCARVELMVLISSDKAVRPSNIMGATKRVCELLIQNMPTTNTRMCGVRFGNVLGSSGSVVPRLLSQIQRGGPVTVTHPDVTRFFMLIDEAVALVLQAGARARAGELCILDMGEPVRIDALARQLIFLSGSVPDKNISVVYTGLRPGEKVHEEVLHEEMERRIEIEGITIARGTVILWERLQFRLEALLEAAEEEDLNAVVINLKALVPDWQPSPRFSRHLESETNPIERRSYRTSDRHNSVS